MIHPNKLPFSGRLCSVVELSEKSPSGTRGHRVRFTKEAAANALPTLVGMGVCFTKTLDRHDVRTKIGIIDRAWIEESGIYVAGYLFSKDFAAEIDHLRKAGDLGMSYDIHNAHVEDMRKSEWTITEFTFTGAAVMKRAKAAYRSSFFVFGEEGSEVVALAASQNAEEMPS